MMGVVMLLFGGALGWPWVRASRVCAGTAPRWAAWTMEATLALATGWGLTGALFFALLWAGVKPALAAFAADNIVLLAGLWMVWKQRLTPAPGEALRTPPATPFRQTWLTPAAGGAMALFLLVSFYNASDANPQGNWDAAATWNLRAKYLAGEGSWRNAVDSRLGESHPEYPLLWSATVARPWAETGTSGQAATPIAAAALVTFGLIGLLAASVTVLRGTALGGAAAVLLLSTLAFWRHAPGQYADLPLALLMLASTATAFVAGRRDWHRPTLMLAGLLASLAAFTKTEGLVFAGCAALAVTWMARGRIWAWLAGAAPVLALTILFHSILAPPGAPLSGALLADTDRLSALLTGLGTNLAVLGILPAHPLLMAALLFAALRWAKSARSAWPLLVLPLMYLLAEMVRLWGSPGQIEWDLAAAVDRPVLQVAPVLYFSLMVMLNEPQSEPEPAAQPDRPPAQARRPRLH